MKKKIILLLFIVSITFFNSCSKSSDAPNPDPQVETATIKITTNFSGSEPATNGEFKITLSNPLSSDINVLFSIAGSAINGTDYETITSSISIPKKTTTYAIPVVIIDDNDVEGDETVIITLSSINNSNVTISASSKAIVTIEDKPLIVEEFILLPEETRSYMVNPNATDETVALFYNLKTVSKTNFIIGQQDAFNSFYNDNTGDSDIKKLTGSDPGLLGLDFMFITDNQNNETSSNWFYQQEQIITSNAIEAYNKGMVNTFSWHFREPYEGIHFYAADMTEFQRENALKSILPGGANHDYYKTKLDKVAEVTKGMVGNDGKLVPIIFRPFHEFDGNWFWWGKAYCTAAEYIQLYQFTVTYLRDEKQVNNMLFAFSPDNQYDSENIYLERYPGDDYVDILGMDNYGDFSNQGQTGANRANSRLKIISDLAIDKVKIAALTETGYQITSSTNPITNLFSTYYYSSLTNNDVEISFVMYWNNTNNGYYTPTPGTSDANDFIQFTDKEEALLQNEIPDMYHLPN
tara:strand:- start:564 stop:2126 length:1563 start_codon:yes stop_codon:yes gene_type:complete